ncbi:hypothetical protein PZA11_005534 [Diplocarpon coronariae]|nr:hypothetical protein JHW43_002955 [Diplocarpon mali]
MPPPISFAALRALSHLPVVRPRISRFKAHPNPFQNQHQGLRPFISSPYSTSTTNQTSQPPAPHPPRKPHAPPPPKVQTAPAPKPEYEMTFTCTPCSTRSTHRVSKQGYHHGSVLITCPECRNRHIISDHLNIFGNKHLTIEDLMREQGQLVKKGTLSEDGNLEFWADGTTKARAKGKGGEDGDGSD